MMRLGWMKRKIKKRDDDEERKNERDKWQRK